MVRSMERKRGESWDRLLHQGIHLLERFAQDDRVAFLSRKRICKFKRLGCSPATPSLLPTWMLSAN
jgi:hypothetical protein